MKLAHLFLALSFLFWPTALLAQISPEPPPLVRFTGSFLPLNKKQPSTFSSLTVSIKDTKWRFQLAQIEELTGRGPSRTRLLQSLFPPRLHFTGPDHLLQSLQNSRIVGTLFTVEGYLYVGTHMFFVTMVDTPKQTPK